MLSMAPGEGIGAWLEDGGWLDRRPGALWARSWPLPPVGLEVERAEMSQMQILPSSRGEIAC